MRLRRLPARLTERQPCTQPEALPSCVEPPANARVLGIDTALRATGVGVVDFSGTQPRALVFDVFRTRAGMPLSACLMSIEAQLTALVGTWTPAAAAIESVFFRHNPQTALLLGHARGIAIGVCARAGIPVYAYAPRRVKQAVVGFGGAAKQQVQHMVMSMLGLSAKPPEDAADALALAICHWHTMRRPLNVEIEPL